MCAQVRYRVFGRCGRARRSTLAVHRQTTAAGSGEPSSRRVLDQTSERLKHGVVEIGVAEMGAAQL
jgi:hypothetical protein